MNPRTLYGNYNLPNITWGKINHSNFYQSFSYFEEFSVMFIFTRFLLAVQFNHIVNINAKVQYLIMSSLLILTDVRTSCNAFVPKELRHKLHYKYRTL